MLSREHHDFQVLWLQTCLEPLAQWLTWRGKGGLPHLVTSMARLPWMVSSLLPSNSPAKARAPDGPGWHSTLSASKSQGDCADLTLWCSQLPLKTASTLKSPPHLDKIHSQEQGSAFFFSVKSCTVSVATTHPYLHGPKAATGNT